MALALALKELTSIPLFLPPPAARCCEGCSLSMHVAVPWVTLPLLQLVLRVALQGVLQVLRRLLRRHGAPRQRPRPCGP